jgi:glycerol-3-phosphate acyltransferase PlsY
MLPLGFAIWYGLGFASVTTLSIGLMTMVIFAVRAAVGEAPWEYVLYGLLTEGLMAWALRPNLLRLIKGTERRHGLPVQIQAWKNARRNASTRRRMNRPAPGPVGAGKQR